MEATIQKIRKSFLQYFGYALLVILQLVSLHHSYIRGGAALYCPHYANQWNIFISLEYTVQTFILLTPISETDTTLGLTTVFGHNTFWNSNLMVARFAIGLLQILRLAADIPS